MITHCISTHNNLPYLKLAIRSVRQHSYWKDAPFIIHAENCTDGTNEWLKGFAESYDVTYYIDTNDKPKGIGGGMNFCAERVETEYINFLHSDFVVTPNWDLELMKVHDDNEDKKLWVNSFRIEPNMFNDTDRPGTHFVPKEAFGAYHDDFNQHAMFKYAKELAKMNDFMIPKGEGVSGLVKKEVWDETGGNDPQFAPTSWDDYDLFWRMIQNGVEFMMPTKSVVWHFGARGSHRLEENDNKTSARQSKHEQINAQKFYKKWGGMPKKNEYGMICGIQ
jgi:GT2 family glycosyltransferase|tara:strand:- start:480 stop:1313 length:834 start_codon:yes stop_codon:yes gene_type:complete